METGQLESDRDREWGTRGEGPGVLSGEARKGVL